MKKLVNGIIVNMTTAEQNELTNARNQADAYEQNLITNRASKIASAKVKLEALGLSVDEIKEAFGI